MTKIHSEIKELGETLASMQDDKIGPAEVTYLKYALNTLLETVHKHELEDMQYDQ